MFLALSMHAGMPVLYWWICVEHADGAFLLHILDVCL